MTPGKVPEKAGTLSSEEEDRSREEQETKAKNYDFLNEDAIQGATLFTGSSLMEFFPVAELARSAGLKQVIYNRGIGGTTSDDFLARIHTVLLDLQPSAVFINIGTNDMTRKRYGDAWMDHLMNNYDLIIRTACEKIPGVEIYMMAYYPTNRHLPDQKPWQVEMLRERTPENIEECNRRVKKIAEKYGQHYIDVNAGLTDENGEQKTEFAIDGVHMYANAYRIVFRNLLPYLKKYERIERRCRDELRGDQSL